MSIEPMTSEQKNACIWVAGTIARLVNVGAVDGYEFTVTAKGLALYDQLDSRGYRPSVNDIANAMFALRCENKTTFEAVCLMAADNSELLKSVEAWELEDIEAKEQA